MFLDQNLIFEPGTQRYEYIQSADAENMGAKFKALIAAIVVENAARQAAQPQKLQFNIYDCDIAGGGDGHTFIVKLLLSTQVTEGDLIGWEAENLSMLEATFWLSSTDEALRIAADSVLTTFLNGVEELALPAVGFAGAAKGTRFMGMLAGIVDRE